MPSNQLVSRTQRLANQQRQGMHPDFSLTPQDIQWMQMRGRAGGPRDMGQPAFSAPPSDPGAMIGPGMGLPPTLRRFAVGQRRLLRSGRSPLGTPLGATPGVMQPGTLDRLLMQQAGFAQQAPGQRFLLPWQSARPVYQGSPHPAGGQMLY